MPGRLFLLLCSSLHVVAFESVEAVVAALISNAFSSLTHATTHPKQLLLTGVSQEVSSAFCGLTGEEPFEAEGEPVGSAVGGGPGLLCAGWTRGVCCSADLLTALQPAILAQSATNCPGCTQNLEAAVCAIACSPELVRPSAQAFKAELSSGYCVKAASACDEVNPCEKAVEIMSNFFGPIELSIVGQSSVGMVPPAETCEFTDDSHVMGGKRVIPSQHRSSRHVMTIWREASNHALTTFVFVLVLYCVGLLLSFARSRDNQGQKKLYLPLVTAVAQSVRPRLDVSRL